MKFLLGVLLSLLLLAGSAVAGEKVELKDNKDKLSYSIGMNIGNNMKKSSIDVNPEALKQGIMDAMSGSKPLMSEQEMNDTLAALQKEMAAKQAEKMKEISDKNKKEGEAFLEENKKKEGVVTLPSGLQYKVIKEGEGEKPTASDTVTVNYRGTLIDGTEFDSSYKRGPATFRVTGVIPGFSEALQLMKTGSKWQMFIPSNLAYGERGAGNAIGPNATLIFEIELMSFEQGQKFHTDQMQPQKMPQQQTK